MIPPATVNLWHCIIRYIIYIIRTVLLYRVYRGVQSHIYRGVLVFDCTWQVYNLGNGGVPVHHDPVDGILANHEK